MIPLSRWLQEGNSGLLGSARRETEEPPPSLEPAPMAAEIPHLDVEGLTRRIAELESTLEQVTTGAEAKEQSAIEREDELMAKLGETAVQRLVAALEDGFNHLLSELESAVVDVLVPFLGHETARLSSEKLVLLVREALSDGSETLLEVRAPVELHDELARQLRSLGLSANLSNSTSIELVFSSRRARFEHLATRWMNEIEGRSE